jgi:putative glutamate/gamma-aminobutyrate antiporter
MGVQFDSSKGKTLSVFTLVMINVIAIDNLRSLTAGAIYGFTLVFFYLVAALLFFIPTILVTAELATGWPNTGGVYIWVREAFGPRWGFLTIWLQWIYNVVWYPTIFAFIAGILAYLIHPSLVDNKFYMLGVILSAFWGTTLVNCFGLKISSWISVVGAIIGTIFPMVFIAILSFFWIYKGNPSQVHFSLKNFFPNFTHMQDVAFLTNILFGLMGMEMSAVHAGDVRNPQRDYPRALLFSAVIILTTLIFSCLAITMVIPSKQLNLVSGLIDAFGIFFNTYSLGWCIPIMAVLIIIGSLSGATAWILGPARGLLIAIDDTNLPQFLTKKNSKNMPVGILLVQGVIVTLICVVFLIMPTVNSSYWVLSNLTAQLALLFYILFFAAAIRLRYKHPQVERAYQIPGGLIGIGLVCGIGMMTCLGAIILGFFPPSQIAVGGIVKYETILILGMLVCCVLPFIFYSKKNLKSTMKLSGNKFA